MKLNSSHIGLSALAISLLARGLSSVRLANVSVPMTSVATEVSC